MKNKRWGGASLPARRDVLRTGSLLLLPGQAARSQGKAGGPAGSQAENPDITIENQDLRLVIGGDGTARSLVEKSTGEECLAAGTRTPVFSMTQYAPLAGQLILLYPADAKTFPARSVRREGDRLLVAFEEAPHQVAIRLTITPAYIAFTVDQVRTEGRGWGPSDLLKTPIEDLVFLQLPLKERTNFGGWLNVMWDERVAVNLLGADPWCRIESQPRDGYRLVRASAEDRVKTTGVSAALIATRTAKLLDRIAEVERDFDLPRGAESRQRKEYRYSYYWAGGANPANIDRHIAYARKGGFPMMMITYRDFSKTAGHFEWRPEYPGGFEDLRGVLQKIKSAGLIPGVHIHYSKADKGDAYVTGKPDHRLNMSRVFTLAEPLDSSATSIAVEENPAGATLDDERRYLKIGSELITYESYTTSPPYRFNGCRRAQLKTQPGAYEAGLMFGVLDVDTWPLFVRFNQNTTLQAEVAQRIAEFYKAGFEYVYFDGAEDVHPPYWFTTGWAQWVVYRALDRPPLLGEGAQRTHFNWHIMTRSNAYDIQPPESMKAALRAYQEIQAPRTAKDFTGIDFGWMGYAAPGERTVGTQPDMVEYVLGRAAGWDCAFSLHAQRLAALDTHPRTPDNLEVMRRWQDAVVRNALTPAQKAMLRDLSREHTLLGAAGGRYEVVPYEPIDGVTSKARPVSAFLFERGGTVWVVYWHLSGRATLELPLEAAGLRLWDEPGGKTFAFERRGGLAILPAEGRRYLECAGANKAAAVRAFQSSRVV